MRSAATRGRPGAGGAEGRVAGGADGEAGEADGEAGGADGGEAGGAGYTGTNTGANGFKTFLPNCGVNSIFTFVTGLAAVVITRVRSVDRMWVGTATVDWTRRRPMPYS